MVSRVVLASLLFSAVLSAVRAAESNSENCGFGIAVGSSCGSPGAIAEHRPDRTGTIVRDGHPVMPAALVESGEVASDASERAYLYEQDLDPSGKQSTPWKVLKGWVTWR